jgi:site-specific recombinase XerD
MWLWSMTGPHNTFARALLAAGMLLCNVADLLGHTSLDTTRVSTEARGAVVAAVVARLKYTQQGELIPSFYEN